MGQLRIPKIIHLTWFSGDPYPAMIQECLKTWKKVLPEYEVKIWNMEMARALNIHYINEALDTGKWAFAADVVRAYAIYSYGGIYMDTDIYVLKNFDRFLDHKLVLFNEYNDTYYKRLLKDKIIDRQGHRLNRKKSIEGMQIQAAILMGIKGHPFLKEVIEYYKKDSFILPNGTLNIKIISPIIYAELLEKYGYLYKNEEQYLNDDIYVGSTRYVSSNRYYIYPETIAVHCINHSWKPKTFKEKLKVWIKKEIGWHDKAVILPQY
jgi:mannosyltransferase OCH1-like enzyme